MSSCIKAINDVNTIAIGVGSGAAGTSASAFGANASALGDQSFAAGYNSIARGLNATAIGPEANAQGGNATAIGLASKALGFNAQAFGRSASALGNDSFAGGVNARAIGKNAFAFGRNAIAFGVDVSDSEQTKGMIDRGCEAFGKLDILIHPESLVHAIVQFNNGITKFIYHDTSMIIPLANAMIHGNFNINEFLKIKRSKNKYIENLIFKKVNKNIFPIIKLKKRINEYPSTSIIINASNEILVDQFLRKKIPFLSINKIIMSILDDRNYKKYAIRSPNNINEIYKIDNWAREMTLNRIDNE